MSVDTGDSVGPAPEPVPPPDSAQSLPLRHMTEPELAERWRITPRTLERWRSARIGPPWLQLCSRVLYREADVLAFEQARLQCPVLQRVSGPNGKCRAGRSDDLCG